ncbi:hypothetical protein [Microcoleus sp. S13_B4]|uniref:hypothetical protein n=1 Tax=Microcoleus sp. S13_B4 TaxID=3055408 RepID=UPI002FD0E047
MIAFWDRGIALLVEIACGRSGYRTHILYFRLASAVGLVKMWSKSGNFSRWARLYQFAIALLIYQQSHENPTNASAGNKSGERF